MGEIKIASWGTVEKLLAVSGASSDDISTEVRNLGLETTTDVIVDELAFRCDSSGLDTPIPLELEIYDDDKSSIRILNVCKSGSIVDNTAKATGLARIKLRVLDVLRGLFAPQSDKRLPTREVLPTKSYRSHIQSLPDRTSRLVSFDRIRDAIHSLLAACGDQEDDLGRLAVAFGSDKWPYMHWYTKYYSDHFAPMRNLPIRILEIGVGGYDGTDREGASLRMWQRYFRRGLVYGLDIEEQPNVSGPRIRVVQGDQNDADFLESFAQSAGPFDIIIDDGSHINEHVKTSFSSLFPHIRPGGFYVIEDLFTAYLPKLGGDGTNLMNPDTSIGMLKGLIDGLYYRQLMDSNGREQKYTDQNITGVYFHHNIAFIEKGANTEFLPVEFEL